MSQSFGKWFGSDPLAPFLMAILVIEVFAFIVVPILALCGVIK